MSTSKSTTEEEQEDSLTWVEKTHAWYDSLPANESAMLNDLMHVNKPDIEISKKLLEEEVLPKLPKKDISERTVLDCGSGIGRVTKYVLSNYFGQIDLVDISEVQLEGSKTYLKDVKSVRSRFISSLPELELPEELNNSYDVVWAQWVVCHLQDDDAVNFFLRVRNYMNPDSELVIVDNTLDEAEDIAYNQEFDDDHVILRHPEHIKRLLIYAGWEVKHCKHQPYPNDICPVWCFVAKMLGEDKFKEWLEPKDEEEEEECKEEVKEEEEADNDLFFDSEED